MLATLIDAPFDNKDWVFENKWDGFRLVAKIEDHSVTLYSRSGLIVSDNYKPIAKELEKVKKDVVIDGELVAVDQHGISRFQLLQNALNTAVNLQYCVFDIMFLDGEDLRPLPLLERKKCLRAILPKGTPRHLQRALARTRKAPFPEGREARSRRHYGQARRQPIPVRSGRSRPRAEAHSRDRHRSGEARRSPPRGRAPLA